MIAPHLLYIHGGYARRPLSDSWVFDMREKKWTEISSIPTEPTTKLARNNHRLVVVSSTKGFIFGGDGGAGVLGSGEGTSLNDLVVVSFPSSLTATSASSSSENSTWKGLEVSNPEAVPGERNASALIALEPLKLLLFGGTNGGGLSMNDIRIGRFVTCIPQCIRISSATKRLTVSHLSLCMSMFTHEFLATVDEEGGKVTWRLVLPEGMTSSIPSAALSPSGRENFGYAYSTSVNRLYIFGGCCKGKYTNELWSLDCSEKDEHVRSGGGQGCCSVS